MSGAPPARPAASPPPSWQVSLDLLGGTGGAGLVDYALSDPVLSAPTTPPPAAATSWQGRSGALTCAVRARHRVPRGRYWQLRAQDQVDAVTHVERRCRSGGSGRR